MVQIVVVVVVSGVVVVLLLLVLCVLLFVGVSWFVSEEPTVVVDSVVV